MNEQEVLKILVDVGAIITDSHIVYTSGKHGSAYVNKDAVYPHTKLISMLCREIAMTFPILEGWVDVVVGPAIGGVVLSQRVAEHLSQMQGNEVMSVYAEKDDGGFVIKLGYDKLVAGKQVLVVEDVLTTGGSARDVVRAVKELSGIVVGVGVLCNRGGITKEDMGVRRLKALVNIRLQVWDEKDCPLCAQDVPINTDVGKGREFLARKQLS